MRSHLEMTVTPPKSAAPTRRSGYTLTILRKARDGRWVITHDAHLVIKGA
ncbi:MAG: hypothetical protein WBP94_16380 [Rhodomicrobiaceae bacterium]